MLPEQDEWIEKLYRTYFKRLTQYAVSALGDLPRAQDVVQDAFHEALIHIDDLITHENPGGWLMVTVKYKIRESERVRRRELLRFLSFDTDIMSERIPGDEWMEEQALSDDLSVMERIVQALTPEEYHLLKRLVLDGASHPQVAQELHISVYASQKRLERIRAKLYQVFPERKKRK